MKSFKNNSRTVARHNLIEKKTSARETETFTVLLLYQ